MAAISTVSDLPSHQLRGFALEQGGAGDPTIVAAQFLGLAVHTGAIRLGVSEFQESMTISVGFSDKFIDESLLRRLLEELDRALPCFAGVPAEIVPIADVVSVKGELAETNLPRS